MQVAIIDLGTNTFNLLICNKVDGIFNTVFKTKIAVKIKGLPYILGAGFFMVLYTLVFFKGLQEGDSGKAGVLVTTTNPMFAYLIGLIVSKIKRYNTINI